MNRWNLPTPHERGRIEASRHALRSDAMAGRYASTHMRKGAC